MKKNLLFAIAAVFMLASCGDDDDATPNKDENLGAKVAGTYSGDLSVVVNGSEPATSKQNVSIEATAGNTITFKLNDFSFMDIPVGDIVVPNIPLVQEGDKITINSDQTIKITSKTEGALGPNLGDVPLKLKGNVKGNVVTVGIDITIKLGESNMVIHVDFNGTKK